MERPAKFPIWVGPVRRPLPSKKPVKAPILEAPKKPDFVLVYTKSSINEECFKKLDTFLFNLEQKGFILENVPLPLNNNINFIHIQTPEENLLKFAKIFNIDLACDNGRFKPKPKKPWKFMVTELTQPNPNSRIYQRAPHTLSGETPKNITAAEKGLVIYKVLSKNLYGDKIEDFGIEKLIRKSIIEAAFPLHDGPFQWTNEGPLNDRQLLTKFWSDMTNVLKQQPLDLVERYYGPEIGFYFAWLGFYNKMLIPASAVGVMFFVLGIFCFYQSLYTRINEVCTSELYLCPRCMYERCRYEPLKNYCTYAKLMYLFDNPLVGTFASLMSIWSTVFLQLWRREEGLLQIRWHLRTAEIDCSFRPEYEETAKYKQYSPVTSQTEPYMPCPVRCYRYAITSISILFLIFLMALGIFGIMIYVKTISVILTITETHSMIANYIGLIASGTGSIISVTFTLSFEVLYEKLAFWLTFLENPRTQVDFDNSFTYKCYGIAFVNYYSAIFYIAFLKARFYTYPGDKKQYSNLGGIRSDLCNPAGCIIELGIQILFVFLAKNFMYTARQYILPRLFICFNLFRKSKVKNIEVKEQWECDYLLNSFDKYFFMKEYMQMVIQYGFVTLFVAAFPPAPLLALLNNIIEMRVDAFKITRAYRRPIAFKVASLAVWNDILQGITYIGVATNALVIAFTSDYISLFLYSTANLGLEGFLNSTLSEYNVSEFRMQFRGPVNLTVCFYPGRRYPPNHRNKYELTDDYWYNLTMKLLAVVVFEHVVICVTGIVAYAIPDVPFSVKEHINYEKEQYKQAKIKAVQELNLEDDAVDKLDVIELM